MEPVPGVVAAKAITIYYADKAPLGELVGQTAFFTESGRFCVIADADEAGIRRIATAFLNKTKFQVLVGDRSEQEATQKLCSAVNSVFVEVDTVDENVAIKCSSVGLPPVFHARADGVRVLSCPLYPRLPLAFRTLDLDGVADVLRWGYPLDGRTIFRDVSLCAANSYITVDRSGVFQAHSIQTPTIGNIEQYTLSDLVEMEVARLNDCASRLPTAGAFFGLSGGLDSRAALMCLIQNGKSVPCISLAPPTGSVDSELAALFCSTYDLKHETILLGNDFFRRLPDLVMEASRITGGLYGLAQSVDLYMYSQIGHRITGRIAGNLGNQFGRGGLESLSTAAVPFAALSQSLVGKLRERPLVPWFVSRIAESNFADVLFQLELPFSSVANYTLGSSRAMQLSPYADSQLMNLARQVHALDPELQQPNEKIFRLRDIRHRLNGVPLERSFQRRYLQRYDMKAGKVPMNWGWYGGGGRSISWSIKASREIGDFALSRIAKRYLYISPLVGCFRRALAAPSELVAWPAVLDSRLREICYDTLLSDLSLQSGIFGERESVVGMLDGHFSHREDNFTVITKTFEICLGLAGLQKQLG